MRARDGDRRPLLLGLFQPGESLLHDMVRQRTGWDGGTVSSALNNAVRHGYVHVVGGPKREREYQLTLKGLAAQRGAAAEPQFGLAERALVLIVASEAGLDSEQLAEQLVSSNDEVMAALDQAADDHRVVACRVVRGGVEMRQYRKSAGSPLITPWTKPLAANAPAREIAAARERTAVLQGVDIDRAHSLPSTGRIEKLTPAAESAAPAAARVEALAEKIVALSEEAAARDDDGLEQWFCLYSSGELAMQRSDGTQVCLDSEETRALFRWLDRLGGTDLQRLAAAEEEVPA